MHNSKYNPYVHFKSPLLYDWCMFIECHLSIILFFQVDILIHKYFCQIDDFTMCLWHLNKVHSIESP
jgi:hypothetical protein